MLIERVLRKGKLSFEKRHVDSRDAYIEALEKFRPDVILSDHALPGFNSREALRLCRETAVDTPFILVSGAASEEFAAQCLREGAADYIPKSTMAGLPTAIRDALKKRKLEQLKREQQLELRRQNRELAKINKALDNFTYRISHHLRGPISTAMGLLNLAHQTHEVKALHELHGMMHNTLQRLDATVWCLLECSRTANCQPRYASIDWKELVRDLFSRMQHLDKDQGVTRLINLQTETPAGSDADRLIVILANIMNNAFIYRKAAKGHETVVNLDVITSPNSISISIRDNGPGIKPETLPKIGEMFFRGTQEGQGAGLGIYVAKEILATLNGTLEISSTEGFGTNVLIELPNNYESVK